MNIRENVTALMRAATMIGESVAVDAILALVRDEMRAEVDAERAAWRDKKRAQRGGNVPLFVPANVPGTVPGTNAGTSSSPHESDPDLNLPDSEADPDPERVIPVPPSTEAVCVELEPFPVNGSPGPEWRLTIPFLAELSVAYPAVDVLAECRKARLWVLASPVNRKTARGMRKFLTGWIGRAANNRQAALLQRPPPNGTNPRPPTPSRYQEL